MPASGQTISENDFPKIEAKMLELAKKDEPVEPVDGTGISEDVPSDEYAPEAGGAYANVGGAVAAAVPG